MHFGRMQLYRLQFVRTDLTERTLDRHRLTKDSLHNLTKTICTIISWGPMGLISFLIRKKQEGTRTTSRIPGATSSQV